MTYVLNLSLAAFREFELEYRKLLEIQAKLKITKSLKCVLKENGLKIDPSWNYMCDIQSSSSLFIHQLGSATKVRYFIYLFIFLIFLIHIL